MIWFCSSSVLLFLNTIVILVIIAVLVFRSAHSRYKRSDLAQQQLISPVSNATRNSTEHTNDHLLKIALPLLAYPIVYLLLCFFAFVHRSIFEISDTGDSFSGKWIFHAFVSSSPGFFVGVTFICHLCLVKKKQSTCMPTTLSRPRKKVKVNAQKVDPTDSNHVNIQTHKGNRKPVSKFSVASGNTTHYPVPHESEVDRAFLRSIQHHMTTRSQQSDLVATDEKISSRQKFIKQSSILETSDAAVTSCNMTKHIPPQESAIDDMLLERKKDLQENCVSSTELQELVAKESSEDGYDTSDAEVTSDEDTTDWRAPPESLVDEAALLRKIV